MMAVAGPHQASMLSTPLCILVQLQCYIVVTFWGLGWQQVIQLLVATIAAAIITHYLLRVTYYLFQPLFELFCVDNCFSVVTC